MEKQRTTRNMLKLEWVYEVVPGKLLATRLLLRTPHRLGLVMLVAPQIAGLMGSHQLRRMSHSESLFINAYFGSATPKPLLP